MDTNCPIHRFVEATNEGDTEAFLSIFTNDAVLIDWGRKFRGRQQIAQWNETDNIGVQSRLRIVSIAPSKGACRVRIAVTGNGFNGEGDMTFKLDGDLISSLVIA